MKKYFEVGQKVYDIRKGQGLVISVDLTPKVLSYAVTVDFANNIRAYYTTDGRHSQFDLHPCLFQNMPIIIENVELLNKKIMGKLISELRNMIKNEDDYTTWKLLEKLNEIEVLNTKPKSKKAGKFVVLMDNGICYILKRKDISSICFRLEPYEKVTLCMKNGRTENFNVSENQEVLENLIADFKS